MNVKILAEDTYGAKFFDELIKRVKNEGAVSNEVKTSSDHIQGVCSRKMTNQINAAIDDFDKTIVVVDGDGNSEKEEKKQKERHFPKDENKLKRVDIIVFKDEIEEWICYSLGIKFSNKPSDALHKWSKKKYDFKSGGYKKKFLPNYVKELKFSNLKEVDSFKKFLKLLEN